MKKDIDHPVAASSADRLRSILLVPKMDCPSEENLIRMALAPVAGIGAVGFDLSARTVTVDHAGDPNAILAALLPLKLGAQLRESSAIAGGAAAGFITTLAVPKMDCPSEKNIIRIALADVEGVGRLDFDLAGHTMRVAHQGDADEILQRLQPLNLGAAIQETITASSQSHAADPIDDAGEARTLRWLLAINGLMFLVEMVWGLLADSTGLIADSLDMFADAAVYVLALYAVGRSVTHKRRAAHLAGWLQLILAVGTISEVIRRAITGSEPESVAMMGIGAVALTANVVCLVLIAKKRHHGAHMKASYIFSANDVIANLGVVIAGALVTWTGSPYPDLVVGLVIGLIVMAGARRILRLQ